jgi:hypothetical protein
MFSLPFSKSKLNLSDPDWEYISQLIKEPTSILVFEEGGIEATKILALGSTLQDDGTGLMRMHIYHNCQDHAVDIRPWEPNAYARKDEKCPVCSKPYKKSVRYDIELIVKYPMTLDDAPQG